MEKVSYLRLWSYVKKKSVVRYFGRHDRLLGPYAMSINVVFLCEQRLFWFLRPFCDPWNPFLAVFKSGPQADSFLKQEPNRSLLSAAQKVRLLQSLRTVLHFNFRMFSLQFPVKIPVLGQCITLFKIWVHTDWEYTLRVWSTHFEEFLAKKVRNYLISSFCWYINYTNPQWLNSAYRR